VFGLIRLLIGIVILGGMIWCGSTVKLGKRTAFGHVRAIWESPEGKDARDGVARKAREVKKDVAELLREDDAAVGSAPRHRARPPSPDAGL